MKKYYLLQFFFFSTIFLSLYAQEWSNEIKTFPTTPFMLESGSHFGNSVAVDGDYAVVGSNGYNNSQGCAYVLFFNENEWEIIARLTASEGASDDHFGCSVGISGDNVLIGAYCVDENKGSVYIYEKPEGGWLNMTQTAILTASDGVSGDQFGCSVSISGDNVVIGAKGKDNYNGTAYVYTKTLDGWIDMTQTAKLTASDGVSGDQFGCSVSISGNNILIGAYRDDDRVVDSGSAYLYEKPVGGWHNMTQTAKITASDGSLNNYFGSSVSMSGDTVLIGAYGDDSFKGAAYLYEKPEEGWHDMTQTAKLTASDGTSNDLFGWSVSITGDNILIGALKFEENGSFNGSAYIYEKPEGGWINMTQSAKLTASDGVLEDQFGYSVSISGDNVLVGAYGDDDNGSDMGATYTYKMPQEGWINANETQKIISIITANNMGNYYGSSVAVDGNYAVVGSYGFNNEQGCAYILYFDDNQWFVVANLTASDGVSGDQFGYSVSISGDNVLIGAYGVDECRGSAYLYKKPLEGWCDMTQTAKLIASDGTEYDYFGWSVCISGDNVLIGAEGGNNYYGSAYIYEKPQEGWRDMIQTAKLTALDGSEFDNFGCSVSISGDNVLIGAIGNDDNGSYSGSAYLFEKPDGGWMDMTQTAKLLASDGGEYDFFGQSVSISGESILIGAPNNDGRGSGYIYEKPLDGWADMTQTAKITALDGSSEDEFGCSVCISGNYMVIGAQKDDDNGLSSGSAYIYEKSVGGWIDMTQTEKKIAFDGNVADNYGCSVSMSGEHVLIGACNGFNDNLEHSGSAYFYLGNHVATFNSIPVLSDNFIVYPNPAEDYIFINKREKAIVKVYSISGELEFSGQCNKVNISNLISGLYIIEVDGKQSKLIKK